MVGYVLMVMFAAGINGPVLPSVAMQRFDDEAACKEAVKFVMSMHPFARTACIRDERKP